MNAQRLATRWTGQDTPTNEWCDLCERDAADIPAEVRVIIDNVCCECWLASVPEIHGADDIPDVFRPLLSSAQRAGGA